MANKNAIIAIFIDLTNKEEDDDDYFVQLVQRTSLILHSKVIAMTLIVCLSVFCVSAVFQYILTCTATQYMKHYTEHYDIIS